MPKVNAIAIYNAYANRVFAGLSAVCALSALLYGFFLLEAVAHAAQRQTAQHKIESVISQLSELEAQYLAKTRSVTLEHAYALGFVTPTHVSVVYTRGGEALSLRPR